MFPRDPPDVFPFIAEGFLEIALIHRVLRWVEKNDHKFGTLAPPGLDTFWQGRVIQSGEIDEEVLVHMARNRLNIMRVLQEITGDARALHSDTLQIVRWPAGYGQPPHADAHNPDGKPHPFPYRTFASITYLNDDFEGGELYFPERNTVVTPKPGMMVAFPGTLDYLHGVRPVTRGVRYTLASFFTHDPSKSDQIVNSSN